VGVFVDEDAATITQRCRQAGIQIAQLHGDSSRACLNSIPTDLQVCVLCSTVCPDTLELQCSSQVQPSKQALLVPPCG
jgi:phosphoribosylanthranilate isomerase